MESKVKDGNYYVVQSFMVKELKLKGLEKDIYAIIYGFSQIEGQVFNGSLQYLADWTNATKQGIVKTLKILQDKNLIVKKEKNNGNSVEYYATQFNSIKTQFNSTMQLSLPNNINNNIENNINNNVLQGNANISKNINQNYSSNATNNINDNYIIDNNTSNTTNNVDKNYNSKETNTLIEKKIDKEEQLGKLCKTYITTRNNKSESRKIYYNYLEGKKIITGTKKQCRLNHIQIFLATQQYVAECKDKQLECNMVQLLSTFLNSRILDYVEKTKGIYEKIMKEKYGDNWEDVRYKYE